MVNWQSIWLTLGKQYPPTTERESEKNHRERYSQIQSGSEVCYGSWTQWALPWRRVCPKPGGKITGNHRLQFESWNYFWQAIPCMEYSLSSNCLPDGPSGSGRGHVCALGTAIVPNGSWWYHPPEHPERPHTRGGGAIFPASARRLIRTLAK